MPYKVGISTGMYRVGKDPGLLGFVQKIIGWGGTAGVRMVQIDVDTTAEFYEPEIEKMVKRVIKKYGMEVGIHGEIGELMSLDSGSRAVWNQSHLRLCETLSFADKFGAKFVNVHMSANKLLSSREYESQRLLGQQMPVVGWDGYVLAVTSQKSDLAKQIAFQRVPGHYAVQYSDKTDKVHKEYEQRITKQVENDPQFLGEIDRVNKSNLPQDQKDQYINNIKREQTKVLQGLISRIQNDPNFHYEVWSTASPDISIAPFLIEEGEHGAYQVVAAFMKGTNDPLWQQIAEGKDPVRLVFENENLYHAAVAAKYLEGHITRKNHDANTKFLQGMSILEFCNKTGVKLFFEVPEGPEGGEGLYRLFNPIHVYYLLKKLGSANIRICLDFEHMISHQMDPGEIIKIAPGNFGSYVGLLHLGKPIAYYGTAHIPIARGSRAQEILYAWIYELRKKGFKDTWMIFERGSGRTGRGATHLEVLEDSVSALRLIAEYLEKDIPPKDLPLEFFGISYQNKDVWAREMVAMRDNAYKPLEGLLVIPEESHTFLSRSAIEKGKQKEWDRAKFR